MDNPFEHPDRYAGHGDVFHRHSHSSASHLGLDFSSIMQAQQLGPNQHTMAGDAMATRLPGSNTAAYESHDDLCVDRCMGVGLYNGFQQFNHRSGPASLQGRWTRDDPVSRFDFPLGFDELSMQFRTADLAPPTTDPYHQPWFGQPSQHSQHHPGSVVPCSDEDCQSLDDSCCDSECTMTGKCTDMACADTDDACTDQNCPSRPAVVVPSSEVVDGAAALISINHPEEEPHHPFGLQQQGEPLRILSPTLCRQPRSHPDS